MVVEGKWGGWNDFLGGFRVATDLLGGNFYEAFRCEAFEGGSGALTKVGGGKGAIFRGEKEGEDCVLSGRTLYEFFDLCGIRIFAGSGDTAGFGGVVLGPDGFREDGADDAFDAGAIVVGNPAGDFQQNGRDERLWLDEGLHLAHGELALLRRGNDGKDCAGGGFLTDGDAHAASGLHGEVGRYGVVEDEL